MSQIKERATQLVLLAIVALTILFAGYEAFELDWQDQPGASIQIAEDGCPTDPGTCGSGGGGGG